MLYASIYYNDTCKVPLLEIDMLLLSRFDQGSHCGVLLLLLLQFVQHNVPVFIPSYIIMSMPPWIIFNVTAGNIKIQTARRWETRPAR